MWHEELGNDNVVNIAAAQFLSLVFLGHGRDHKVLQYLAHALHMGNRMVLIECDTDDTSTTYPIEGLTVEESRARLYAAWGLFNWITQVHQ